MPRVASPAQSRHRAFITRVAEYKKYIPFTICFGRSVGFSGIPPFLSSDLLLPGLSTPPRAFVRVLSLTRMGIGHRFSCACSRRAHATKLGGFLGQCIIASFLTSVCNVYRGKRLLKCGRAWFSDTSLFRMADERRCVLRESSVTRDPGFYRRSRSLLRYRCSR